ncbi:MAG: CoA-binding protein [Rhodocyclaceae bacterium]|jgi:predicted CoA-binding protein|nr:CoA-binding protein [Rhodocyclaceae bacterium]MBK6908258.1 CoA-binding protein [Rhodocyclaceae bacterium]
MRIADDTKLRELLRATKTIAVVGISDKPYRDSHHVAEYLIEAGYRVFPVNPNLQSVLGLRCYPDLASIPEAIDLVDVFRRPEEVGPVVDAAVAIKAKALWLQLGVINEAEAERASEAGLTVIMDRCSKIEHARLIGFQG